MASDADIKKHERVIQDVIDTFNQRSVELLQTAQDQIAALGTAATRQDIQTAFQPLRDLAQATRQQLDTILQSNIEINSDVLNPDITSELVSAVDQLKSQAIDRVTQQIDAEQNAIIETVVLAGVAGAVATDLISQTRDYMRGSAARLTTQLTTSAMQFDTVVTRLRSNQQGVKRYQYVGGVIDTTRPFCEQLDGGIYTEEEIQDIWRDTWSGKAPGDPFVVRGGYNCRHFWVPVEDE